MSFEVRIDGQLSARGADGREVRGEGTVVLAAAEVLGVQTHALHWELPSWRQSAHGTVYLANIVGCVAVDDRTVVVR